MTVDQHHLGPSRTEIDAKLRSILVDALGLDEDRVGGFDNDTGLFGHLPELDSMAVAGLLTEMEDQLDIIIDDDDVDGEMLETFGGLLAFALSFDEVIVTNFTAGAGVDTVPLWVLSAIQRPNALPVVNVVAVFLILLSVVPVYLAQRLGGQAAAR